MQYELGLLYLQNRNVTEAVDLFEKARKATDYTFDKALWYRSQEPYNRAKKIFSARTNLIQEMHAFSSCNIIISFFMHLSVHAYHFFYRLSY